jgi:fatty acid amide hydrolase
MPAASAAAIDRPLWYHSAQELARLIASGEISAREVVDAHIERIEAINPKLNAVVVERFDAARREAAAVDGKRAVRDNLPPLAGVPITVKECLDLAGTPSTFGITSRANTIASADEQHVARLRAAGAIVLGKTNDSQLLITIESDNPVYGRSNNPWNPDRTCGGSSGGEGAIIAAGGSALGLGTDIGGSSRYPAAFCGIIGFKPTAGRCPCTARFSIPIGQQAIANQIGILARKVDDVIAGLATIDGGGRAELGSGTSARDVQSVRVRELHVGFYTDDGVMRSSPAVRRAVNEAAAALQQAGVNVTPWQPPDIPEAFHLLFAIFSADRGAGLKRALGKSPVDPAVKPLLMIGSRSPQVLAVLRTLLIMAGQRNLAELTRHFGFSSVDAYWRLVEQLDDYRRRFARAMESAAGGPLDAILGPVCALPPLPHGAAKDLGTAGANTLLYNVLGYPAGVVPVTVVRQYEESERKPSRDIVEKAAAKADMGSAGLPIGVQIAAVPWADHVSLALMQTLECQIAWNSRPNL